MRFSKSLETMGGAASLGDRLTEAQAKHAAGGRYDQDSFDRLKGDDDCISKADFILLIGKPVAIVYMGAASPEDSVCYSSESKNATSQDNFVVIVHWYCVGLSAGCEGSAEASI